MARGDTPEPGRVLEAMGQGSATLEEDRQQTSQQKQDRYHPGVLCSSAQKRLLHRGAQGPGQAGARDVMKGHEAGNPGGGTAKHKGSEVGRRLE